MTEVLLITQAATAKQCQTAQIKKRVVKIIEDYYYSKNGRGSWTRTNGCQDQNLMPYQLGYTPVMSRLYTSNT